MPAHDDGLCFTVMPDMQTLVRHEPARRRQRTRWLLEHADELALRVVRSGDVVEDGGDDEDQIRIAAHAHRARR